jgi:hypothetical protein
VARVLIRQVNHRPGQSIGQVKASVRSRHRSGQGIG